MRSDSGKTTSLWMDTADVPAFKKLAADATADVCIVGAGIAGLTTAYLLARAGRSVVVLDDGPIGGGETGRTTAHITAALDDRYFEIEKLFGEEKARYAAESHTAAINRVDEIVRLEHIDCDFERVDGYLFLIEGDTEETLRQEHAACHRAGLADVRMLSKAPIASFHTGPVLHFPRQAQFHPLKYISGLARAITRDGGRIHTGSHAKEMRGGTGSEPGKVVTEDGHTVTAMHVVICTNTPVNDWVTMHTKQAPYRTYVVAGRIDDGVVARGLYWDTGDVYHYVRLQRAAKGDTDRRDWIIVGGEDHKTGQADDMEQRFEHLVSWTKARFPMVDAMPLRWSGQVMEPVDYMGFIGRNPGEERVYIATGDSGNGMTHGTIAGLLIADLVQGRDNLWASLYDPSRKPHNLSSAGEFLKENLNVAAQYRDYVTPGEVDSRDEIQPGEGAVLRRGTKKVAVYRDAKGAFHERSAVCTHLYCIVNWNRLEKSWDCPCHGSRFDPMGKVVNGPAVADLPEADAE
jgi:glycine/D-amino acid oxidase-like deaminating enzyme/nitrite reductase/ring-hydroxylating ferredoxin subunit